MHRAHGKAAQSESGLPTHLLRYTLAVESWKRGPANLTLQ